jgi:hypothetical protein
VHVDTRCAYLVDGRRREPCPKHMRDSIRCVRDECPGCCWWPMLLRDAGRAVTGHHPRTVHARRSGRDGRSISSFLLHSRGARRASSKYIDRTRSGLQRVHACGSDDGRTGLFLAKGRPSFVSAALLDQPQPLETRVPVLANDEVIVNRNAERACHRDDRFGHLDVGGRRRRIARGMIVH